VLHDGALYVEAGIVRAAGPYESLRRHHPESDVIGDGAHLIIPGFINAHSHGRGVTTLRQGIADEPGEIRSIDLRVGLTVDPYWDVLLTCARQLEGGITSTMHLDTNYGFGPPELYEGRLRHVLAAYAKSGIRFSVAFPIRNPDADDAYLSEAFLASLPHEVRDEVAQWRRPVMGVDQSMMLYDRLRADYPGVTLQLEPVGPDAWPDDLLVAVRKKAAAQGAKVQLHLLETAYQKAAALATFGKTSVERLAEIGFLDADVSCAHCVWVTESDIRFLRDSGAIVVHNPSSNLRLRSGLAPVKPMAAAGVSVALGVDNLGMNDDEDMLQEVRLAQLLHSPPGLDQAEMHPETVLRWATEGGVNVVGNGSRGRLEIGCPADLVMAHLDRIKDAPSDTCRQVAASVVQWVRQSAIDQVMVGGQVLVRGGRYVLQDRDELERKAFQSRREWRGPAIRVVKERIAAVHGTRQIPHDPYYPLHSRH
jgi:cytosine/adenosine deaminase-related metal-dependent hydrolase